MRTVKIDVPHPSSEQVEHYLRAWDELENIIFRKMHWTSSFLRFVPRTRI